MTPLRVLYVLNSAGGGATQGIIELLRGLPREQYQAFIVLPHDPSPKQAILFKELTSDIAVIPLHWWNHKIELLSLWRILVWAKSLVSTLGGLRPQWALMKLIRQWQIDIVYTDTAMILDGALAAYWSRRPHLWHIKEWIGRQGRVKFSIPDAFLIRIITGLSRRVLVMSHFIGDIFENYPGQDRVELIYDGVCLSDFEGNLRGKELRQHLGVADNECLIGMSASLSSVWKQHHLFIQMASILARANLNVRFVAFGPEPVQHRNPIYNRPWEYYQSLRYEVDRLELTNLFIWAGFQENIPQMMDAIDVLVHPCDTEPFGRVAIEAMAARRPIVGPDRGGIAESVIDGKTGLLVAPGDASAFADAVTKLVKNSELRHQIGLSGFEHVAANFSLERHIQQIKTIYASVSG